MLFWRSREFLKTMVVASSATNDRVKDVDKFIANDLRGFKTYIDANELPQSCAVLCKPHLGQTTFLFSNSA